LLGQSYFTTGFKNRAVSAYLFPYCYTVDLTSGPVCCIAWNNIIELISV
jgi:hypothetical protein